MASITGKACSEDLFDAIESAILLLGDETAMPKTVSILLIFCKLLYLLLEYAATPSPSPLANIVVVTVVVVVVVLFALYW